MHLEHTKNKTAQIQSIIITIQEGGINKVITSILANPSRPPQFKTHKKLINVKEGFTYRALRINSFEIHLNVKGNNFI